MNKKILERLRKDYPRGTRVKLLKMDDDYAPPVGTVGRVEGVDDIGSIMVSWDNGSSLSVIYEEDEIEKVKVLTDEIKKQILTIRDTGRTNMFDINQVQRIAYEMDFYDLVTFLEDHREIYSKFILTGEEN